MPDTMERNAYKRKARILVNEFLRICGLGDSHRCTRIVVEKDLKLEGRRAWGYMRPTTEDRFILGLMAGMDDRKLAEVIGHEVSHLLTNGMIENEGRMRVQWEEFTCDLVGRLLADRIKT